jgi:hypothetical protein
MDQVDYLPYYDSEKYLLGVGERFRQDGRLDPSDFYMLLIWKADRAKNYHKRRLEKIAMTFSSAVAGIASDLYNASELKRRLQVLMGKWEFALPTATAILTILYPNDFTVYDWRVCVEVDRDYKPWRGFSDSVWEDYLAFKQAVIDKTPANLCLRDKDRFLIGRSTRIEVESDCVTTIPVK